MLSFTGTSNYHLPTDRAKRCVKDERKSRDEKLTFQEQMNKGFGVIACFTKCYVTFISFVQQACICIRGLDWNSLYTTTKMLS